MNKYDMRQAWHKATSELPYGVQSVFKDILLLVAEGKKKDLVWGTDYTQDGACLVNAGGNMLTTSGGHGIPSQYFGDVVTMFDRINQMLLDENVNTDYHVSPLAAEVLVQWFGIMKEEPTVLDRTEAFANNEPYIEPDDAEMAKAFAELINRPEPTPFDRVKNETVKSE